jgi:SAM-dependent methyltransferase
MTFDELKARQSEVWGSASWERVAPMLAPVHEHLVRALGPGPGVRWLDLGTGTGALALLAARAGADVIGVDLAPRLIQTARRLAAGRRLSIRFDVGDAEALPYEDGSFDVVSSAMGLIFAPEHRAVACELARVCRPGGRIGFSAWREGAGFGPVTGRYAPPLLPGQGNSLDWGRAEYAEALLGEEFELSFDDGDAPVIGDSGEQVWQLLMSGSGLFKARAVALEPDRREQLHDEFVRYLEEHRGPDGINVPAPYVLVLGLRRP